MTTKLLGPATRFLPFNTGSNGPGQDGGSGNPVNPAGYRTAYLWEQVWQPDNWLRILGEFVHVRGRAHAVPALPPMARGAGAARRDPGRPARARTGSCSTPRGRASRTRSRGWRTACRGCTRLPSTTSSPRRSPMPGWGRPAGLRQGRGHHRPQGARPAAAGDRERVRARAWVDRDDRPGLAAAQGRVGGHGRADHRDHAAEVPGGRGDRGRARSREGNNRHSVRGHRGRGALDARVGRQSRT